MEKINKNVKAHITLKTDAIKASAIPASFVYGYLIVASDDNIKSRIAARKCLFLKTTGTPNALNSTSSHNCAASSRSCQKGLAPGRYLHFSTTDDYPRRSLNNETSCTNRRRAMDYSVAWQARVSERHFCADGSI